jgi:hypothetical protein
MITEEMVKCFNFVDDNGYTILHYIARDYNECPCYKKCMRKVLKCKKIQNFINIQENINGDTALHIAVKNGNNELSDVLIRYGADPNIRNKVGLRVGPGPCMAESELKRISPVTVEYVNPEQSISDVVKKFFGKPQHYSPDTIGIDKLTLSSPKIEKKCNMCNIIDTNLLMRKQEQAGGSPTDTIGLNSVKNIINKYIYSNSSKQSGGECPDEYKQSGGECPDEYKQYGGECPDEYKQYGKGCPDENKQYGKGCEYKQFGGGYDLINMMKKQSYSPYSTETLHWNDTKTIDHLDNLINDIDQIGGKKRKKSIKRKKSKKGKKSRKKSTMKKTKRVIKKKKGKRKVKGVKRVRRAFELSRLLGRQTDEIRQRVLEKINTLLKKMTKKAVDEVMAMTYRAMLWNMVKEKFPDMKSNLDKHIEMEKLTTADTIKEITKKHKNKIDEISKHIKEKMEKRKNKVPKIARMTEDSESPVVMSESPEMENLSSTSDMSRINVNQFSPTSEYNIDKDSEYVEDEDVEELPEEIMEAMEYSATSSNVPKFSAISEMKKISPADIYSTTSPASIPDISVSATSNSI